MKPAKPIRVAPSGRGPRRRTPAQALTTEPTIGGSSSASRPNPAMTYPAAPHGASHQRDDQAGRNGQFGAHPEPQNHQRDHQDPVPDPDEPRESPDADPGDEDENGSTLNDVLAKGGRPRAVG